MKKELQERLKSIANEMATLETKDKKTDADHEAYKALVGEGKTLRDRLTVIEDADAWKAWAKGSDGQNAAKKTMSQELTDPADREQEQRAEEAATKSAYKSAFEAYLRFGRHIGPNDFKILRTGAIKAGDGELKALGETSAAAGGVLVPEQFMAEVLKKEPGLIGLTDSVRKQPTTRDVLVWPKISYTTDNQYTAPHRLTFTGEVPSSATVHNVTDQTFGEVRIPVNLAMASQKLSNSLIEDSATDVMGLTAQLFNENIMQDVEYYLCNGTGSGQPEGLFVNATAQTNYSIGGSATIPTTTGLVTAYWGVPAQYRKNARWLMSSATALQVGLLADANGRFIWQGQDMFGGGLGSVQSDGVIVTQPRLLGLPLLISEHAPALASDSFSIAVGNFKGYIQAERVGMTVRVLDELYAETDQKLFLLRYRFGGGLAEDYKVKLVKTATS